MTRSLCRLAFLLVALLLCARTARACATSASCAKGYRCIRIPPVSMCLPCTTPIVAGVFVAVDTASDTCGAKANAQTITIGTPAPTAVPIGTAEPPASVAGVSAGDDESGDEEEDGGDGDSGDASDGVTTDKTGPEDEPETTPSPSAVPPPPADEIAAAAATQCTLSKDCPRRFRCFDLTSAKVCLPCAAPAIVTTGYAPVDDGSVSCKEGTATATSPAKPAADEDEEDDPEDDTAPDGAASGSGGDGDDEDGAVEATPAEEDAAEEDEDKPFEPGATTVAADTGDGPTFTPSPSPLPTPPVDSNGAPLPNVFAPTNMSTTTTEADAVCVEANALLRHLPASELVFARHRRARVLCDALGSCATPGHVVVFRGAAMLMRSYCASHAACTARHTLVNSPRMRHRRRVPALTEGLEFTALAARYESQLEERVLRTLIRAGV